MRAILPPNLLHFDEPQIGLVDERRCLKRVPCALLLHVMPGQPPQLLIDKRQQRVERTRFASIPGQEQRRRVRGAFRNVLDSMLVQKVCCFFPPVLAL